VKPRTRDVYEFECFTCHKVLALPAYAVDKAPGAVRNVRAGWIEGPKPWLHRWTQWE
jgi:hypothetical protein